jgi:hypothetical protein
METTVRNGKWTNHLAAQLFAAAMLASLSFGTWAQTPAPAAAQAASVDQAVAVAQQWLAMGDAEQAAAMWEQASPVMKSKTSSAYWVNHIATLRNAAGQATGPRVWTRMEQEFNSPNLPAGRFMGVQFVAPFTKAANVVEIVSLVWEGGRWTPVGYQFGAVPAPQQAEASPPARQ